MPTTPSATWHEMIQRTVKAEMLLTGATCESLSKKLSDYGTNVSPKMLAEKLEEGNMDAVLFFQLMTAMGRKVIIMAPAPED